MNECISLIMSRRQNGSIKRSWCPSVCPSLPLSVCFMPWLKSGAFYSCGHYIEHSIRKLGSPMLKDELSGDRGRLTTQKWLNVPEIENLRRQNLENQTR